MSKCTFVLRERKTKKKKYLGNWNGDRSFGHKPKEDMIRCVVKCIQWKRSRVLICCCSIRHHHNVTLECETSSCRFDTFYVWRIAEGNNVKVDKPWRNLIIYSMRHRNTRRSKESLFLRQTQWTTTFLHTRFAKAFQRHSMHNEYGLMEWEPIWWSSPTFIKTLQFSLRKWHCRSKLNSNNCFGYSLQMEWFQYNLLINTCFHQ